MGHRARPACGGCAVTHVVPVGCRDCPFLDWPVCTAPFLCWGMLAEFADEMETPGGDDDRGQSKEVQPSTKE